jgi:hypothetical protein
VPITPDNLPDDPAALKHIIAAMAQDALTAQAEIARLKFQLARYRRPVARQHSEAPIVSLRHPASVISHHKASQAMHSKQGWDVRWSFAIGR